MQMVHASPWDWFTPHGPDTVQIASVLGSSVLNSLDQLPKNSYVE